MNISILINYRNGEFIRTLKNSIDILEQHSYPELKLEEEKSELIRIIAALEKGFKIDKSLNATPQLRALNIQRNDTLIGIRYMIRAYRKHRNPSIKAHAETLNKHLNLHGHSITRIPYQEKTEIIHSLIKDWQEDKDLLNAIESLQLEEWIAYLSEVNTTFDDLYIAKIKELYQSKKLPNTKAYKRKGVDTLKRLLNKINAYAEIYNDKRYLNLYKMIATLISEHNEVLKNRRKKTD